MARRKNNEIYKRALELYTLDVLTTEDTRKDFDALSESEREKKVNGYKQRNKALFVGVRLQNLQNFNGTELNKLKKDLQDYIIEVNNAIEIYNNREIKDLENQITESNKQHENQITELNKQHEKEISKLNKKIEEIKNKKEETKKEEKENK